MSSFIVHVGMPKCASTLLQKQIFPNIEGIDYVQDLNVHNALGLINYPGGEEKREESFTFLEKRIIDSIKPVLFSSEHLVMPPHWLYTRRLQERNRLGRNEITNFIKKLKVNTHILIIIRRQEDWLPSWYQERVKRYEIRPYEKVLASEDTEDIFDCLLYDKLVKFYVDIFGRSNVHIIPFELLRKNSDDFFHALSKVIDLNVQVPAPKKVKGRMTSGGMFLRRQSNKVLNKFAEYTGGYTEFDRNLFMIFKKIYQYESVLGFFSGAYHPESKLNESVLSRFASSNRALDKEYNLRLSEYGYLL